MLQKKIEEKDLKVIYTCIWWLFQGCENNLCLFFHSAEMDIYFCAFSFFLNCCQVFFPL
uniref:Uncharacterized protein DKFZp781C0719 n=1 Tax=Homo sapiens TaxID=9606 RepID=Q68DW6_HUMAN|nr:hypothetical protein [Homo sapiens]